ncbi:hypothetical protein L209DRAFT_496204 [Thermothelomyces heterothallicus CBS 203.75]
MHFCHIMQHSMALEFGCWRHPVVTNRYLHKRSPVQPLKIHDVGQGVNHVAATDRRYQTKQTNHHGCLPHTCGAPRFLVTNPVRGVCHPENSEGTQEGVGFQGLAFPAQARLAVVGRYVKAGSLSKLPLVANALLLELQPFAHHASPLPGSNTINPETSSSNELRYSFPSPQSTHPFRLLRTSLKSSDLWRGLNQIFVQ